LQYPASVWWNSVILKIAYGHLQYFFERICIEGFLLLKDNYYDIIERLLLLMNHSHNIIDGLKYRTLCQRARETPYNYYGIIERLLLMNHFDSIIDRLKLKKKP
jgi:hypothetical protein